MIRIHRSAILAVLALSAGCIRFPTDAPSDARRVAMEVTLHTQSTGTADSVAVNVAVYGVDGGRRIRLADDTLRVQNVVYLPEGGSTPVHNARLPLDNAARTQGLRVRLPVPVQGTPPVRDFTLFSAMRATRGEVTLGAGEDLSLPVITGAPGSLPEPTYELWNVTVARGERRVSISGTGPLPSPLIIPRELIPSTGPQTLTVNALARREFQLGDTRDSRVMQRISVSADLAWTVRIAP